MRALTVQQPWAWAIVHGGKDVENRTQAWTYRGPLAIHAGARVSDRGIDLVPDLLTGPGYDDENLVRGAVIGVVDLVGIHVSEPSQCDCGDTAPTAAGVHHWTCPTIASTCAVCESAWAESSYAEHGGRTRRDVVHLVLENPRPLEHPIPARGRLGLWTPDAELLAQIREQVPA